MTPLALEDVINVQQQRPWLQRLLALAVAFLFLISVGVSPAEAAKKGFSGGRSSGFSSGGRSFSSTPKSTPKPSAPKSTPAPKPSTSTPSTGSKSFSSPKPSTGSSSSSGGYSSTDTKSYSSGDRSFSSSGNPFSSTKSTKPIAPPPSYDLGKTTYPSRPPVVIVGSSPYDTYYWHNYYWGRPWYWRVWHSPTYNNGSWAINWVPFVLGAIGLWILAAMIISRNQRRRRF